MARSEADLVSKSKQHTNTSKEKIDLFPEMDRSTRVNWEKRVAVSTSAFLLFGGEVSFN